MINPVHDTLKLDYFPEPIRILILDDDPVYTALIEEVSENLGCICYRLHAVEDIEYIEPERIDLIFLDYQLGSSNGLQIAPTLVEHFGHTPIVLISSNSHLSELQRCSPEVLDFLPKSLSPDEMVQMGLHIAQQTKTFH